MLKLLLTAAIPFQGFVDKTSPTHRFINQQALIILTADGMARAAAWLGQQLEAFNQGCDWVDQDWRNISHMYDPETGTGLRGWPSAPQALREYWDLAVRFHAERNLYQAAFYLGAAAHLVQDLCVPHHAAARIFSGHKAFEAFARRYRHRYAAHTAGLYDLARTPEGWVTANAQYTRRLYTHCITAEPDRSETHLAVADLLPRAQRTTAGFLLYFLQRVGVA